MKSFNFKFPQPGKGAFYALFLAIVFQNATAQSTYLIGKVLDSEGPLTGASVKASRKTDFVRGAITDLDGNFRMSLDSGTYQIEITYTAYQTQRVENVRVLAGQINVLPDVTMSDNVLAAVEIVSYKVPLIEQDKVSSGQALTSEQVRQVPTRKVGDSKSGKKSKPKKEAEAVNIKGSRPTPTNYYVDGIKVSGVPVTPQGTRGTTAMPEDASTGRHKRHAQDSLPRDYSAEHYNTIVENPFQDALSSNISTFSIDVDAASYSNLRRFINQGNLPPVDAVRIEEMVNYFDYQYNAPVHQHPFEANVEVAPCPWNPANRLMMIGMQGATMDVGQLPASNFVFLIDVSGSMGEELSLVKESLILLTEHLRANDRVAIVVYAGAAGLVLESTPGSDKAKIKAALEKLQAGGSTAGGEGIKLAYEVARKNLTAGGNNRVILCTDGDFNVGVSGEPELVKIIETERESGVYLSVLGYGEGNYQDGKMQALADKGNGNHAYIDQVAEAKKVLIKEFGGTLFAIAKDVKLQLHFNPEHVAGYRLIGYENRMLATEDFNDDTKDAGELGVGHRVTALYEIVPKGQRLPTLSKLDSALVVAQKPDKTVNIKASDLMVLQMRYKKPKGNDPSQLMEYRLGAAALDQKTETANFKLASGIAEFGLLLRDSKYKGTASYARALSRVREAAAYDPNGYRAELAGLIETAGKLAGGVK